MRHLFIITVIMFVFQTIQAQENKLNGYSFRFGYGYALGGSGDTPGQQMMMGLQNQLSEHSLVDIRLSGTWMEQNRYWENKKYSVMEKSNGISLEADYGFAFRFDRFTVYPSLGPALRYSHEVHPRIIGITYASDGSGTISKFETKMANEKVFRMGATGGFNVDIQTSKKLTLGLRSSVQLYNGGQTIAFFGLTMKHTRLSF